MAEDAGVDLEAQEVGAVVVGQRGEEGTHEIKGQLLGLLVHLLRPRCRIDEQRSSHVVDPLAVRDGRMRMCKHSQDPPHGSQIRQLGKERRSLLDLPRRHRRVWGGESGLCGSKVRVCRKRSRVVFHDLCCPCMLVRGWGWGWWVWIGVWIGVKLTWSSILARPGSGHWPRAWTLRETTVSQ